MAEERLSLDEDSDLAISVPHFDDVTIAISDAADPVDILDGAACFLETIEGLGDVLACTDFGKGTGTDGPEYQYAIGEAINIMSSIARSSINVAARKISIEYSRKLAEAHSKK